MGQKLCSGCGKSVNKKARFCESCGQLLSSPSTKSKKKKAAPVREPEPEIVDTTAGYLDEFDSRESAKLSHEYFERHLEILKSYRKLLKIMAKNLEKREQELGELADSALTEERSRQIQETLESIEAIGDEWEDLQVSYNQDSEVLDEEFQERFAELEFDVELPGDLQEKIERELAVMTRAFDHVGDRIATIGKLGNRLISQASGRFFGTETAPQAKIPLLYATLTTGVVTFVVLRFGHGLEVSTAVTGSISAFLVPMLFISRF